MYGTAQEGYSRGVGDKTGVRLTHVSGRGHSVRPRGQCCIHGYGMHASSTLCKRGSAARCEVSRLAAMSVVRIPTQVQPNKKMG